MSSYKLFTIQTSSYHVIYHVLNNCEKNKISGAQI